MPNMRLTHREALDVSSFLLQSPRFPAKKTWQTNDGLVAAGKAHFMSLGCASCHTGLSEAAPKANSKPPSVIALDQANTAKGCLAVQRNAQPKSIPNFHLSDEQRRFIVAAIAKRPLRLTDQQQVDHTLHAYNCTACHQRDQVGGVTAKRNPYFKTTNLNLGDLSLIHI